MNRTKYERRYCQEATTVKLTPDQEVKLRARLKSVRSQFAGLGRHQDYSKLEDEALQWIVIMASNSWLPLDISNPDAVPRKELVGAWNAAIQSRVTKKGSW